MHAWQAGGRFVVSLILSCYLSLSLYTVFSLTPISQASSAHILSPLKALLVINLSIVTETVEHVS